MLDSVTAYLAAGYSVIPVYCDGTKRPAVAWKEYQTRRATDDEVHEWYAMERGIGIVCGAVSGGLEVLDFDEEGYHEEWAEAAEELRPGLVARLALVKTPAGIHVWYRCDVIEGNLRLAQTPEASIAIETRGEGGYVLAPGSPPGVHSSGEPYEQLSGPDIMSGAPRITPEERDVLLRAARGLNRYIRSDHVEGGRRRAIETSVGAVRPGDVYNESVDIVELLEGLGWVCVLCVDDERRWRRPGKDVGWSATTGHCTSDHSGDLFYVFSSNAEPFESGRAYSSFAVYALSYHDGDYVAAARDLLKKGYGAKDYPDLRPPVESAISAVQEEPETMRRRGAEATVGLLRRASRAKVTVLWDLRNADRDERPWNQESIDTRLMGLAVRAGISYADIVRMVWSHRSDDPPIEPEKAFDVGYMSRKIGFLVDQDQTLPKNQSLGDRASVALGEDVAPASKRETDRRENELDALDDEELRTAVGSGEAGIALEEWRKRTGLEDVYGVIRQGEDPWDCRYIILLDSNERLQIGTGTDVLNFFRFRIPIYNHFGRAMSVEVFKGGWDDLAQLLRLAAVDEIIPEDRPNERIRSTIGAYLSERGRHDDETLADGISRRDPLDTDGRILISTNSLMTYIYARFPTWKLQQKDLYHQLRSLGFDNQKMGRRDSEGKLQQAWYWGIPKSKLWVNLDDERQLPF